MFKIWGIWGDNTVSLMYQGFQAPQILKIVGEIPQKSGEMLTNE